MNTRFIALGFVFMLFSNFVKEKPLNAEIIVTGLRFNQERTDFFKNIPKQPAFTIDAKGVLRPTPDYQIIYVKADKALVVLPTSTTYSTYKTLDGFEEVTLEDGSIVWCNCKDGRDNCRFEGGYKREAFVCKGTCTCFIGVAFNIVNPPLQYETGGQWFNF